MVSSENSSQLATKMVIKIKMDKRVPRQPIDKLMYPKIVSWLAISVKPTSTLITRLPTMRPRRGLIYRPKGEHAVQSLVQSGETCGTLQSVRERQFCNATFYTSYIFRDFLAMHPRSLNSKHMHILDIEVNKDFTSFHFFCKQYVIITYSQKNVLSFPLG